MIQRGMTENDWTRIRQKERQRIAKEKRKWKEKERAREREREREWKRDRETGQDEGEEQPHQIPMDPLAPSETLTAPAENSIPTKKTPPRMESTTTTEHRSQQTRRENAKVQQCEEQRIQSPRSLALELKFIRRDQREMREMRCP